MVENTLFLMVFTIFTYIFFGSYGTFYLSLSAEVACFEEFKGGAFEVGGLKSGFEVVGDVFYGRFCLGHCQMMRIWGTH